MGVDDTAHLIEIEGKVVAAFALDDLGAREAGDVAVKGIRRLEHRGTPARPSIGEQGIEQDFVRAIGREHLLCRNAVVLGQCAPQLARGAIGIAVPFDARDLVGQQRRELGRRRLGRLVRVEPHVDRDLR